MENGLRRIPNYLLMRSEFSSLNAKAIFCINTALGKLLSWSTWPRIRRDAVKNSIRLSSVFAIITYAVEKCNFPRTLEAKGPACTHTLRKLVQSQGKRLIFMPLRRDTIMLFLGRTGDVCGPEEAGIHTNLGNKYCDSHAHP